MIRPKRLLSASLLWPLFAPASVSALVVDIQGIRLETHVPGASCVEIFGNYPGVKIVPSENGKIPRICYNSNKVNSISILDTTFIAQSPVKKDVLLKFEHEFPSGINGKVMTRAKLQGFFSTSNGVGIPSGDQVLLSAFFSQNRHDDPIGEPFSLTVGDDMESALFEYSAKEQYLISGPRVLKGSLKLYFSAIGNKLTLHDKNQISIDTGSTMADKLETIELPTDAEPTEQGEEESPLPNKPIPLPGKQQKKVPGETIPFPKPSDSEAPPLH